MQYFHFCFRRLFNNVSLLWEVFHSVSHQGDSSMLLLLHVRALCREKQQEFALS